MPTFFYAVNGVGLGHIARLSVLEAGLLRQGEPCAFFSPCKLAPAFFQSAGAVASDPSLPDAALRKEFAAAVQAFTPDTVVCDTYWLDGDIGELKRKGIRTLLIMRLLNRHILRERLQRAESEFSDIVLPHSPQEVAWIYREDPALLQYLSAGPFNFIGPLCRQATEPGHQRSIIFTLGGGGEQYNPGVNTRANILSLFRQAAVIIKEELGVKPILLAGPLLPVADDLQDVFEVVRGRSNEFAMFGPNTVVVSRGGYNTAWEAIYAGSPLVLCGSYSGEEDIVRRCDFLEHNRLAAFVKFDTRAMVQAVKDAWAVPSPAAKRIPQINCGLDLLAHNIAKRRPFRGLRRPELFNINGAFPGANGATDRLVARFDCIDPQPLSAELSAAIRYALDLGYRAQLHLYRHAPAADARIAQLLALGVELWLGGTDNGHPVYNGQMQMKRGALEDLFHCRVAGISWQRGNRPPTDQPLPASRLSFVAKATEFPDAEVCVDVFDHSNQHLKNELKIFGELAVLAQEKRVRGLRFPADAITPSLIEYALRLFARPL
jgi:predicted glycosyltransferase